MGIQPLGETKNVTYAKEHRCWRQQKTFKMTYIAVGMTVSDYCEFCSKPAMGSACSVSMEMALNTRNTTNLSQENFCEVNGHGW